MCYQACDARQVILILLPWRQYVQHCSLVCVFLMAVNIANNELYYTLHQMLEGNLWKVCAWMRNHLYVHRRAASLCCEIETREFMSGPTLDPWSNNYAFILPLTFEHGLQSEREREEASEVTPNYVWQPTELNKKGPVFKIWPFPASLVVSKKYFTVRIIYLNSSVSFLSSLYTRLIRYSCDTNVYWSSRTW